MNTDEVPILIADCFERPANLSLDDSAFLKELQSTLADGKN